MDYETVKQTVQDLVTQGVRPTRDRVREALGGGSFETLSPLLRRAKDELGITTPGGSEEDNDSAPALLITGPTLDPARVQAYLADIQGAGAVDDLLYHAAQGVAHVERMLEQLALAMPWCVRVSGNTWSMNDIDTRVLQEAAQELRRVVLHHGQHNARVHVQGEQSDGPTAA